MPAAGGGPPPPPQPAPRPQAVSSSSPSSPSPITSPSAPDSPRQRRRHHWWRLPFFCCGCSLRFGAIVCVVYIMVMHVIFKAADVVVVQHLLTNSSDEHRDVRDWILLKVHFGYLVYLHKLGPDILAFVMGSYCVLAFVVAMVLIWALVMSCVWCVFPAILLLAFSVLAVSLDLSLRFYFSDDALDFTTWIMVVTYRSLTIGVEQLYFILALYSFSVYLAEEEEDAASSYNDNSSR